MRSYWFSQAPIVPVEIELASNDNSFDSLEMEPKSALRSVVIKDLSKVVPKGSSSKSVLHDVSLQCYQGQITTLVGHNEAGKTSLINILTGKEQATKGTAFLTGMDVSTNMTRKFIGVCPQHNVLYDELSVEQHLKMYAGMKGTPLGIITKEVEQVMNILKLSNQKSRMVSHLSYAEKRKLSLAIAFIGGSKVLLLDEPTYGLNSEEKRHVWDALQAIKHDRTVIVATQSFEEADILGDRVAVIAGGSIHGYGTPAHIKQKLGAGCHLHVLKDVNFDLQGLKSFISKYVSTVTCENESLTEVSFNLGDASELEDFFNQLESSKNDFGFISYGVSSSSIRDVLTTVTNISQTNENLSSGNRTEYTASETEDVSQDPHHPALHANLDNQFRALILKHFNYCKRRWKFHIIQLAVPFIMMLVCFYCIKSSTKLRYEPLELDISSVYGSTEGFYYNSDATISNLAEEFKKVMESNDVGMQKVSEPTHYVLDYGKKDLKNYLKRLIVGGAFDRFSNGFLNLTAWHNSGSFHSMPLSLLLMQTALLRHITNTGSISLTVQPVISLSEKYDAFSRNLSSISWASIFVPLAISFLSLTFILMPTTEKEKRVKLLQLMSGIPAIMYWIAIFLWDYLIYFLACIFLILTPAFFFPSVFFGTHSEAIGTLLVLLFLYGWASLPLGYVVSVLLKRENRGLSIFIVFCMLFSIIIMYVLASIAPVLYMRSEDGIDRVQDAHWFFRLFPLFSFTQGTEINFHIAFHNAACDLFTPEDFARCKSASTGSSQTLYRCCKDICDDTLYVNRREGCHEVWNHFSMKKHKLYSANGPNILCLGLEGIIFFAILALLETRTVIKFMIIISHHLERMWNQIERVIFRRGLTILREENTHDPQVLQEEERIQNSFAAQQAAGGGALDILGLKKNCGAFNLVNRLTFGVNGGECFGILGVNGSGKTSILKMLTGEEMPSEGNAFIQSYSLLGNFREFRSRLGYCPDIDPVMDDLTGREMLLLFGQLRGLRGYDLQKNVNDLIKSMGLVHCSNELTQFYSGEERRKLSVAIALVGSLPVILLDEPTAGMGPESRRQIWKALTRVRKRTGSAILLTTQSAEESKTLCNRQAIIVNERFRCLGSSEQLKSKYGKGCVLTMRISEGQRSDIEKLNVLKNHMQNSLKNATLIGDYQGKLQYQVADASMTIGHLFQFMSNLKTQFELEDYSIGAMSLEQIFHVYS